MRHADQPDANQHPATGPSRVHGEQLGPVTGQHRAIGTDTGTGQHRAIVPDAAADTGRHRVIGPGTGQHRALPFDFTTTGSRAAMLEHDPEARAPEAHIDPRSAPTESVLGRQWGVLRWLGPLVVLVVAALSRLLWLGMPKVLVFDETYYVKDAWTLWHLGYEGSWGLNPDKAFNAGHVNGFLSAASFATHPPLGKWIIGIGEVLTGGTSPFGWRITTAIVGILAVGLVMVIAHRLWRDALLTTIAGGLMAIDNLAIGMSRIAILDNQVMFFALLGVWFVLEDRYWAERRIARWIEQRYDPGETVHWGPTLWRPWLLAAAVAFGLCSAVKWSGLWYLAFFGVYVVLSDMLLRRRCGITFWYSASVLKQLPATFLTLVPPAVVTYVLCWSGWLLTSGGWDRQHVQQAGTAWTGFFAWVPRPLQNLVYWHQEVYQAMAGLTTPHAYSAPAILWPLMARPTSFFWQESSKGQNGCVWSVCASATRAQANPLIWYAAVAAALYLVWRFAARREWRAGLLLMGIAAGWLPWLLYPQRTIFFFYTIAFLPYLILCLTLVIGLMLKPARNDPDEFVAGQLAYRASVRRAFVWTFLVAALLVSIFFYPLNTGMQTPFWFWQIHNWTPSWI